MDENGQFIGADPALMAGEDPPLNDDDLMNLYSEAGPEALTEQEFQHLMGVMAKQNFAEGAWHEDLSKYVDEGTLGKIAADIRYWVEWDEASRAQWSAREIKGMELLGITDDVKPALEGLSTVMHPALAEACVQFHARAMAELFPPEGPVKAGPLGKPTEATKAQAERVQDFMNYQYIDLMEGAIEEHSRMLMRLPLSGSGFMKVFYDPVAEQPAVQFVEPSDFLVPYSASDLRNAPRYTHRRWESDYIVKKMMQSGFYRKIDNLVPATEAMYPEARSKIEKIEGREQSMQYEDRRRCILECHINFAIKGLSELEAGPGDAGYDPVREDSRDGAVLPWIITVDKDAQQVLAIRRNWRQGDERKRKRIWFSHKKMFQGLGFYGLGFVHMLGSLSRAQSGIVRAYLDSASYENLQGGFVSREAKIPDLAMKPGQWTRVDSPADDLAKAFFPIPRHQASDALFKLLQHLDELAQRFSGTTEAVVGDANNNAPVGTTLALIEQAMKVPTAIHQGLHRANREEFKLLAELNAEFLPSVYPYATGGKDAYVLSADFDDKIDVVPVSDARIVTNTQRIAQAQALRDLATAAPQLYDLRAVNERMLDALRIEDIDGVLVKNDAQPENPVDENMAMLMGRPVQAFPEQLHEAHYQVHAHWFSGLMPEYQQQAQAVYMAHQAEHVAWAYRLQIETAMGFSLPYPDFLADKDEQPAPIPPETQRQIEMAAAQAVQHDFIAKAMSASPSPQPDVAGTPLSGQSAIEAALAKQAAAASEAQNIAQMSAAYEQQAAP